MAKSLVQLLLFAGLTGLLQVQGVKFDFGDTRGFCGWTDANTNGLGWQETLGVRYPSYVTIPKPPTGLGEYIWLELRNPPYGRTLTAPPGYIDILDGTTICGQFYRHVTIDDNLDRVNLTLTGYNTDGQPYSRLLLRIDDYDVWKYAEITCGTGPGQEPCCPIYPCGIDLTFDLTGLNVYSEEIVAVDYIATALGGTCG